MVFFVDRLPLCQRGARYEYMSALFKESIDEFINSTSEKEHRQLHNDLEGSGMIDIEKFNGYKFDVGELPFNFAPAPMPTSPPLYDVY